MSSEDESSGEELFQKGYPLVTVVDGVNYCRYEQAQEFGPINEVSTGLMRDSFVSNAMDPYLELEDFLDEFMYENSDDTEGLGGMEDSGDAGMYEGMEKYLSYEFYVKFPAKITKMNRALLDNKKKAT